jgi:hypothetical protein
VAASVIFMSSITEKLAQRASPISALEQNRHDRGSVEPLPAPVPNMITTTLSRLKHGGVV